jgi:small-conductance mechanosensitive channel
MKMASALAQVIGDALKRFFSARLVERAALVVLILVAGYCLVALVLVVFRRLARKRLSRRAAGVVEKAVKYVGVVVILANAAEAAGLDLSAALGAAGIAGIALGFAAQTSVSNIISGLFLFSEKTFEIGDVLQIENMTGTIESVDLLSVKIRTFDNRLVRVPNEMMIKSRIVNATRWPERRLDLKITLPLGADPAKVERLLMDAAKSVPEALSKPEPSFSLEAADAAGLRFAFGVWFRKQDYSAFKTGLLSAIMAGFEGTGFEPALQPASIWDFPDGP